MQMRSRWILVLGLLLGALAGCGAATEGPQPTIFVLWYSRRVHHNKAHDLTNQAMMRGIPEIPALVMNGTTILTRSAYLEQGVPSLARLQALIDAAREQ
jgi:hypothetical protein